VSGDDAKAHGRSAAYALIAVEAKRNRRDAEFVRPSDPLWKQGGGYYTDEAAKLRERPVLPDVSRLRERRVLWRWLCAPWMSLLALALLVGSIFASQVLGTTYRNVVGFAVDPLLVAVLIAQIIALHRSPLWRWLSWRWVRYLGTLSYSIYLYQQVVIHPVRERFAAYLPAIQLAVTLGAVFLFAAASYHLVERPFLRLKDRIGGGRGTIHVG